MPRLLFFSLLNGLLLAQTPPAVFDPLSDPSLIENGLRSTVPLQVAISAFRAASVTDQRRGEWLREALLRSSSLQPETEAVRTRRAILDALIRTRTPVRLTELLPFFDQFPGAVIAIVAKNNPREGEDRLPLLQKAEEGRNSVYWYAALSLVDRKQLVHYLVQQARFDYAITVQDEDFVPVRIPGGGPGRASGVIGGIMPGMASGSVQWPPETIYHIEMSGDIDDLLTTGSWRSTYLRKWSPTVHAFPDAQPAEPLAWEDHDHEVVRILVSFAYCGLCSTPHVDFQNIRGGKATIVWHSLPQARPLLEKAVEWYAKECVSLVEALHETTVSESEIRSKVRIWLRDWRRDQTVPIPSVGAGVEFNRCTPSQSGSSNRRCID